jgi:hypothetical protein
MAFFFYSTEVWTQGLILAGQLLYHLSHAPSLLSASFFPSSSFKQGFWLKCWSKCPSLEWVKSADLGCRCHLVLRGRRGAGSMGGGSRVGRLRRVPNQCSDKDLRMGWGELTSLKGKKLSTWDGRHLEELVTGGWSY